MTAGVKRPGTDSSGSKAKKNKAENDSSISTEQVEPGLGGSDPKENKTENESVENGEKTSEFGGKSLEEVLRERSISTKIITKCTDELSITSVAELRKLKYSDMVQNFKKEEKGQSICSIDWKHMLGLWSGDVLPVDFIPPLRNQCRASKVDLKYAEILEDMDVTDLKDVDETTLQKVAEKAEKAKEEGKEESSDQDDDIDDPDESSSDEPFDQHMDNLRSAVGKAKDRRSCNVAKFGRRKRFGRYTGEEEADEDGDEEPTDEDRMEALKADREATRQEKEELRQSVKDAMANMNVEEVSKLQGEALKSKLEEIKSQIQAPIDIAAVGGNPSSFEDMMTKVNTDAIFMSSTDYIPPYTDNKDLVAAASGGIALNGIGVFWDKDCPLVSSTMPLLAPPDRVTTLGTFSAFEAKILKTTSEYEAASFQSNASSFGMSMAESMQSETSASASFSGRFVSASASAAHAKEENSARAVQNDSNSSSFNNLKTQTAQITEYIVMPMRSFRIPRTAVKLSEEAIYDLGKINEENKHEKARAFFTKFGTHVSRGRHTMGGIFFRKISMTSDQSQSANKMFSAAGEQLEKSKKSSTEVSAETAIRYGRRGGAIAASRAQSKGSSSSMGSATVGADEEGKGGMSCTYTFESRCLGPNASSPEEFANVLQSNNAIWACIDRGDPTNLLGVWEVIEEESRPISEAAKIAGQAAIAGRKADNNVFTNAQIASLLKNTWLKMLSPRKQTLWKENPSIKHLLRESHRDIYDELSQILISFCEPLSYVDKDKFKVFTRTVSEAIAAMVDRPRILPPSTWITDFLFFGRAALSDDKDKTVLDGMTKIVDVKASQDAAGHAAKFVAHDWIRFNRAFHDAARAHRTIQQEAKALIPADGEEFNILSQNPSYSQQCWVLKSGKTHDGNNITYWKPDPPHNEACIFTVERVDEGDGSFRLIPKCAPSKRVCMDTNKQDIQIKGGKALDQEFLLYKPISTYTDPNADPNTFVLLNKKDTTHSFNCSFNTLRVYPFDQKNYDTYRFTPVDRSEKLNEILLSCQASPITYADKDKFDALRHAVQKSSEIMVESVKFFPPAIWLQSFLSLGSARLSSVDKSLIDTMTKDIDVKLQQEAHGIATQFTKTDWGRLYQSFEKEADEYWNLQKQAKELLPAEGVQFKIGTPSRGAVRWTINNGGVFNGAEIAHWIPDPPNNTSCLFTAVHVKDGSFALRSVRDPKYQVDETNSPGVNCTLYLINKGHLNQKFVLYKPRSSLDKNTALILSWKDRRYGLDFGGPRVKTVVWKNNECPFFFELL